MPSSPAFIVLTLSLLVGLQTVTTDLYLPALPMLSESLGGSMGQAQLTLTALLLAFGCSQLVWGPLSDRFGRRPILLWGISAYLLASVACALASSISVFIAWRMVQGAAMGAAVMGARAIVRDLYAPLAGAHVMTKAQTGLGILACICGPIGGVLADTLGWRATLFSLTVFGAATLAVVAWRFKESVPVKNPLTLSTATYTGLFTFLAASSFVFIQVLGLSKTQYGFVMSSMPLAYIAGTFICRRLLPRIGVRRAVVLAGGITLAGGTLMGGLAWAGISSGWAIMPPFYLYMLAHGVHQPCAQSGAVGPFPHAAGAAPGLRRVVLERGHRRGGLDVGAKAWGQR